MENLWKTFKKRRKNGKENILWGHGTGKSVIWSEAVI